MSESIEAEIQERWQAGDFDGATTATLRGYGDEVFSFLVTRMRSEDTAGDVFAQASEDLWTTMASFEWRCSMRTWIYRLARNAAVRHERTPANRRNQRVALSQITELAAQVRSRTLQHMRSEVRTEVHKLRDALDAEEQTLLTLRVDRELDWNEIAAIMNEGEPGDAKSLERASARLRQRFQKLKQRLRDLAEERGLLRDDG
jgi:RNA polymerase sigma-70 factor (ECF subfamily)